MDNLEFKNLLICFSVASILIGAFGAVDQFKIKRFLGFTTINQMGFIFLGVSLQNLYGFVASYVYLCIYICLNLILFFFILNIKTNDGKDLTYLSDLVPFFKANKLTGMFFVLLLFSLAGMPPTIGFYMKLLILKSLVISGHIKLTLVILYVNVFSILYYVRIIKILFFDAESILFSDRTEFSKKTSFFEVFKTPFSEVKNIEEIVQNRTLYTKFIVFCFRQLLCYALVLFFLSGI
jgi:NADH-quinone oxidoreductase subunit N